MNIILYIISIYLLWKLVRVGIQIYKSIPSQLQCIPEPIQSPLIVYDFEYTNTSGMAEHDLDNFLENLGYTKVDCLEKALTTKGCFYRWYIRDDANIYRDPREVYRINCKTLVDYDIIIAAISDIIKKNQYSKEDLIRKEKWQDEILSQGYYQG